MLQIINIIMTIITNFTICVLFVCWIHSLFRVAEPYDSLHNQSIVKTIVGKLIKAIQGVKEQRLNADHGLEEYDQELAKLEMYALLKTRYKNEHRHNRQPETMYVYVIQCCWDDGRASVWMMISMMAMMMIISLSYMYPMITCGNDNLLFMF